MYTYIYIYMYPYIYKYIRMYKNLPEFGESASPVIMNESPSTMGWLRLLDSLRL